MYGLCRPYRVAAAGALILAGAGLSHSPAQVNAAAGMRAGSGHSDTVTLVTVKLDVNQVRSQQPLQESVAGLCDAEPVCGVLPDNQTMLLTDLLEQAVVIGATPGAVVPFQNVHGILMAHFVENCRGQKFDGTVQRTGSQI